MADIKTESKKKGREHYSSEKLKAERTKKRIDAEARQLRHESLSLGDRIKKAQSRRGESKKEISRLQKLMEKAPLKKTEQVPPPTEQTPLSPKPKKNYQKPKRS